MASQSELRYKSDVDDLQPGECSVCNLLAGTEGDAVWVLFVGDTFVPDPTIGRAGSFVLTFPDRKGFGVFLGPESQDWRLKKVGLGRYRVSPKLPSCGVVEIVGVPENEPWTLLDISGHGLS